MSRTNTCKLQKLRAKTDLELAQLIRNRLERGLALVQEPAGNDSRARAEQARAEAHAWLPLAAVEDRAALEPVLAELGQRLDGSEVRVQAACW
jgi:hypothetical protein